MPFIFFLSSTGLWITTECGKLQVSLGEIVVIPQGFRFSVDFPDGPSRGYVAEIFGTHFQLMDLGPIGLKLVTLVLLQENVFQVLPYANRCLNLV